MKNNKNKFNNEIDEDNKKANNKFLYIIDKIQNSKKGYWITIAVVVIFLFVLFAILVGVKII